jgi:hypothetical protein
VSYLKIATLTYLESNVTALEVAIYTLQAVVVGAASAPVLLVLIAGEKIFRVE